MSNYEGERDPRTDPRTAPVFSWGGVDQPYADRSIRAIVWFFVILVGVSMFFGWYMFGYDSDKEELQKGTPEEIARVDQQLPGNPYSEESGRSGVYDFFYQMFGGIEDGLEDSPHNIDEVEWIKDLNMEESYIISTSPYAAGNVALEDIETSAGNAHKVADGIVEERFDGKILDFEGHVIGEVDAIKYKDGDAISYNFVLREALVPEDKSRLYTIPEDKVKVVQQDDLFFIQLNEKQTRGLAAALHEGQETKTTTEQQAEEQEGSANE